MAAADTEKRPDAPDRPRSPFASTWWIVSAVVVALIVAMLVWLLVQPPYRPGGGQAAGGHRAAPHPVTAGSVCGLTGGDQTPPAVPLTPGSGFAWALTGTVAVPTDPVHGPGVTTPVTVPDATGQSTVTMPDCYSPDPWGAVFAAYGFIAASSTPALRWAAADHLAAAGPGRDAALEDLQAGDSGSRDTGVQVAGFHFTDYRPATSARLDMAVTTGQGGYARFPLTLVWEHGDWLVDLPVTGSPYTSAQTVPTLAGYVPFQGA